MLSYMNSKQSTEIAAAGRGYPGHASVSGKPEARTERLRAMLAAEEFFIATATEMAVHGTSAVEAATLALIVERAHRHTAYTQILAAQAAQRTLAHEMHLQTMEQLCEIVSAPATFLASDAHLPPDLLTPPRGRTPHKNTAEFLQHLLGIGYFEARDRVNAVNALLPHLDTNGTRQPARYPLLSADAQAGTVDPKHVIQTAKKLDRAAPIVKGQPEPEQLSRTMETRVLESLRTQGPQAANKLIIAWHRSLEDQTGCEPIDEEISSKTGIFLTRRTQHFSYFSLCMLNVDAEILLAHFANADNPRTEAGNPQALCSDAARTQGLKSGESSENSDPDEAPRLPAWAADPHTPFDLLPRATYTDLGRAAVKLPPRETGPKAFTTEPQPSLGQPDIPGLDGLTPARRRLRSILNVLQHVDSNARKRGRTLARAKLVVHCQLETLLGLAERAGITTHGLEVSPGQLRRLLCDAAVLPIVFNGESQVLDIGREQRFVPEHMREAVLARDGGCLVPSCTVPPEHCEMCHIDAWQDGGSTSVGNSGPGCSAHHHDFHSGKLKLVRDRNGLPAVLLPKHWDPEQVPRRNEYWQHQWQTNPKLF